jgi:hypothetical protein
MILKMPKWRWLSVLPAVSMAWASACAGPEADTEAADEAMPAETADQATAAAQVPEGSTLQAGQFNDAEFTDELVTADGSGKVFVVVDCDPMTGGNLVTINPVGFAEGTTISAKLDPSIGGEVVVQIGPAGSGVGARQATLDEAQYTLTVELDGEMLETSFAGCAEGNS